MTTKEFSKKRDKTEYYARLWFASMANYHCINNRDGWQFDETDVISFLKSKVEQKMPTWKRLGIVNSLIWYRNNVRKTDQPSLEMIRTKLQERLERERLEKEDVPIEEVVGKINPREPDVIQQLRRQMRLMGRAYNTEKAYVQKVNAFMAHRGLKNLADFGSIGASDVEAHLTVAKSESAAEVTTAERRGTLVGESDLVSLSSDASDARMQATRGNWIRRAGVVFASIVCSARRLATGVSSNSA